ncbi:MAG: hypothetical protein NC395_01510 [Prevotella sp.]|nr:hypothetical protein [Prevotella sp.]
MKKILAAILSVSLCGAMLTACGSESGTDTDLTESITSAAAETETKTETEATETETETTQTETETEAEDNGDFDTAAALSGSYASVDDFAKDSGVFSLPTETISAADSLIYNFVRTLEGATEFYMDVETTDGSVAMVMAMSGKDIYMKMSGTSADQNLTIMVKDSLMYMLDDSSKSGYYMTAGEAF